MRAFFEKLYKDSKAEFFKSIEKSLVENKKVFTITANPEIFMQADSDPYTKQILLDSATTIIADGIGIVKGSPLVGLPVKERIPGVELAEELLRLGNNHKKSIYLFGAKKEILEALTQKIKSLYPNLTISGCCDGYVADRDLVFEEIKALAPDIVMVALGVPAQEKLIYKHLKDFDKGIFVGVGGSFDVLSGLKQRAPKFFIKHNLEWLYRISKEPKRIKRFYKNNIKFFFKVKKL